MLNIAAIIISIQKEYTYLGNIPKSSNRRKFRVQYAYFYRLSCFYPYSSMRFQYYFYEIVHKPFQWVYENI